MTSPELTSDYHSESSWSSDSSSDVESTTSDKSGAEVFGLDSLPDLTGREPTPVGLL